MSSPAEWPVVLTCAGEALIGILHSAFSPGASIGVLIVVGGPQYRVGSHRQFVQMARELAANGYPAFRFDYRGMGDSAAKFGGFERIDVDIRAAIDAFMKEMPALNSVVIFGLCDAAAAALMYGWTDARVHGLILANPWVRTAKGEARSFVRHYYAQRLRQRAFWRKLTSGKLNLTAALGDFIRKWVRVVAPFRNDSSEGAHFIDRMLHGLNAFRGPILVVISERDLTAHEFQHVCRSSRPWSAAMSMPNVAILDCPGADHTFSTSAAFRTMMSGTRRWLASAASPAPSETPEPELRRQQT